MCSTPSSDGDVVMSNAENSAGQAQPKQSRNFLGADGINYMARDERARAEEERGIVAFKIIENNKTRQNSQWLFGLKDIFSRQLPNMPREYIVRMLMDRKHRCLVILKLFEDQYQVIGGICFRTFLENNFIEIVFCAITSTEQVKGYGSHLMNHMKDAMSKEKIYTFLTYADNYAIGYFSKQGFTKEITLDRNRWVGYIKDYEGGTLMECIIHPGIKSYLEINSMIKSQREAIYSKIRQITNSHIIRAGIASFPNLNEKIADKAAIKPLEVIEIPGLNESGFFSCNYFTPDKETRKQTFEYLKKVFEVVKKHPASWPFHEPVDIESYPNYPLVVKNIIDLSLIKTRLMNEHYYITPEMFFADIQRMCNNCKLFNDPASKYYQAAVQLGNAFKSSDDVIIK